MTTEMDVALIVEGKYRLNKKIGEGAFGKIFSGVNRNTNEEVAVKIERVCDYSPLQNEARIYAALRGMKGVPKMRSWGTEGNYNYLVIDLMGESLEQRRINNGGTIELKQAISFGIQMLERIRDIHECGLLHRDVKPGNFIFGGRGTDPGMLYMIDFGMTKVFRSNYKHIALKRGQRMLGTEKFASIHIHEGLSPSRRDDIESLGYVIVYLLLGELPWQNLENSDHNIAYMKCNQNLWNTLNEQCISKYIIEFLKYSRTLEYEDKPDYEYLIELLEKSSTV